jgi:LEA14-like dessication related protein
MRSIAEDGQNRIASRRARVFICHNMKQFLCLLACLPLLIAGCASQSTVTVGIVNVRLTEMTAFETTATFTLRYSNESPAPVELTGGVHKIYLNGLYVGKGLSSEALVVPRLDTAKQDVTVHLSNLAMITRIKPVIESKSFDYRIKSVLYGKSWMDRMSTVSEGRLDMRDFTPTPDNTNSVAP